MRSAIFVAFASRHEVPLLKRRRRRRAPQGDQAAPQTPQAALPQAQRSYPLFPIIAHRARLFCDPLRMQFRQEKKSADVHLNAVAVHIPSEVSDKAQKTSRPLSSSEQMDIKAKLEKLPLYFIENRGQVDDRVAFYIQSPKRIIYFTPTGVTFVLTGSENKESHQAGRWYDPQPGCRISPGRTNSGW